MISAEIIELCFIWYHLELFIFKSSERAILNEDKTTITQAQDTGLDYDFNVGTCYGSIIMPSMNDGMIYEYTVKLSEHADGVGM